LHIYLSNQEFFKNIVLYNFNPIQNHSKVFINASITLIIIIRGDEKMKKQIGILLVIALIALTGCQQEGNTINVQGNSEITTAPDEAEIWAGVSIVEDKADEAQGEVNKAINAILSELKQSGIQETNIKTEQLSLYEERTWTRDGGSKVIGWRATQILKIKTKDLTKVGEIVDIAVTNGANRINNIQFKLSEEKELEFKKKAIADATKSAKEKAETIADSLGVRLANVKTASEANFYAIPYAVALESKAGDDLVEEAAVVMPGDVTVTANINLVYNVR